MGMAVACTRVGLMKLDLASALVSLGSSPSDSKVVSVDNMSVSVLGCKALFFNISHFFSLNFTTLES